MRHGDSSKLGILEKGILNPVMLEDIVHVRLSADYGGGVVGTTDVAKDIRCKNGENNATPRKCACWNTLRKGPEIY